MATVAYALGATCSGGGHAHVDVSVNGMAPMRFTYTVDELRAPLSDLAQEERERVALVIAKLHLAGLTRAQARIALQAGFTVTI